ncbi:hypothetical protein NQZ68_026286 [Dissostichus eleginoides]|nr:hypothetical protein NQZ68_026286 [Dissostichus eleginoides]
MKSSLLCTLASIGRSFAKFAAMLRVQGSSHTIVSSIVRLSSQQHRYPGIISVSEASGKHGSTHLCFDRITSVVQRSQFGFGFHQPDNRAFSHVPSQIQHCSIWRVESKGRVPVPPKS